MTVQRMTRPLFVLSLLCGVFGVSPARAAEGDTTTVTVTGVLVAAPECTVNGNNQIDVDFGDDVLIGRIDGSTYKKTALVYSMLCDDPVSTSMKLSVNAAADAGFGTGLIGVGKEGLGIRLFNGTSPINAGDAVNFTYDGSSLPSLYAVPVAENISTLSAGGFSGSATMVIDYQ